MSPTRKTVTKKATTKKPVVAKKAPTKRAPRTIKPKAPASLPTTFTVELDYAKARKLASILKDVLRFASDDAIRPILCSVKARVLGDGTLVLVATDSYILGEITWAGFAPLPDDKKYATGADWWGPALLDRSGVTDLIKLLARVRKNLSTIATLSFAHDVGAIPATVTARWNYMTLDLPIERGEFPKIDEFLEEKPVVPEPIALNFRLGRAFSDLTLGESAQGNWGLRLSPTGTLNAVLVKSAGTREGVSFRGAWMPVRIGGE